jgi:shikimate kinase/3-dehydroquinate synthase
MAVKRSADNIILVGFSGTGKTVVSREVARRIGWEAVDTDEAIVHETGKTVPGIFAEYGERRFRELERRALREALKGEKRVVATGGGAVLSEENRNLMKERGVVIRLEARVSNIIGRLRDEAAHHGESRARPLLATDDPETTARELKAAREESYTAAQDMVVVTDDLTIDDVAQEVIEGWQAFSRSLEPVPRQRVAAEVRTGVERYQIIVGWGILDLIGDRMRQLGLSGRAVIISDSNVFHIYGRRVKSVLEGTQYKPLAFVVPSGETSKSFEVAVKIYDFLVSNRVERNDTIIALGGGVVGDLAGYVAASYLRGIPYIQVPTSLIAMVDASIGGKVAVNHPQGKNLVGAFYQPKFVLADVQVLTTLPKREVTSGWAEVIKHGLVLDPDLFDFLKNRAADLIRLVPEAAVEAVARSAAVKAEVVSQDERETGIRTLLNYGHTIGHGLEAAGHYETFTHGEAVAIGMVGAAKLSQRMGLLPGKLVKEHESILQKYGLPVRTRDVKETDVFTAMQVDKKTTDGAIRWVLLEDIGHPVIRSDVDVRMVASVLEELLK